MRSSEFKMFREWLIDNQLWDRSLTVSQAGKKLKEFRELTA